MSNWPKESSVRLLSTDVEEQYPGRKSGYGVASSSPSFKLHHQHQWVSHRIKFQPQNLGASETAKMRGCGSSPSEPEFRREFYEKSAESHPRGKVTFGCVAETEDGIRHLPTIHQAM